MRAEVALLSRNILIQGSPDDYGCRLLLAPAGDRPQIAIQGAELVGCGQQGTLNPSLQILGGQGISVQNSSLHGNNGVGIAADGAGGLELEGNVVVDTIGTSVSVLNSTQAR